MISSMSRLPGYPVMYAAVLPAVFRAPGPGGCIIPIPINTICARYAVVLAGAAYAAGQVFNTSINLFPFLPRISIPAITAGVVPYAAASISYATGCR